MASASLSNTIAREDLLDLLQASLDETENLYTASRRLAIANTYDEMVTAITEGLRIPSVNRGVLIQFEYNQDNQITGLEVVSNWHSGWGTPPTRTGVHYGPDVLNTCPRLISSTPLFFDDMHQDAELVWAYPNIFDREHTSALAILPLWVGKRQLGVLLLESEVYYHFSEREIRSYPPLLGQMAIAIENLRLFRQTQEALAETRALYDASQPLASPEELSGLLQSLSEAMARALPAHRVILEIFDVDNRRITYRVQGGLDLSPLQPVSFTELESSLTGWVMRERKPALSPKGTEDPRESLEAQQSRLEQSIGSVLVVPLLYHDRILGALSAFNRLEEPDFNARDITFMTAIANQAAIAVANTQLFEQTQKALAETEALYQASAELNVAHAYDEILNTLQKYTLLGENAQDLSLCFFERAIPTSSSGEGETATLIEPTNTIQIIARSSRISVLSFEQTNLLRTLPSTFQFLHYNAPTIIPEIASFVEFDENTRQQLEKRLGAKSAIFIPLVIGGQWIGYINAIYQQPMAFPEDAIRRLVSLTNQAAVAVQNLRSIAVAEKRADEALLQFQTAQRLSQAQTETELFNLTLEACRSGVRLTTTSIQLLPAGPTWDIETTFKDGYLEQGAHFVDPGLPHVEDGSRYPVAAYPFAQLLLSGQVADSQNTSIDPRITRAARQWLSQNGLAAVLLLPLLVRGHGSPGQTPPAGVLVVGRTTPEPFTSAETTFLQTIATQLSFALDNLRLLQETRQLLQESRRRAPSNSRQPPKSRVIPLPPWRSIRSSSASLP